MVGEAGGQRGNEMNDWLVIVEAGTSLGNWHMRVYDTRRFTFAYV